MRDFLKLAKEIENDLITWRRNFHSNPELGFEEENTSKYIKEFLEKENIEYYSTAKTGICGIIRGDKADSNSKTLAIRADIDALPIQERNKCSYASKNPQKMHACGHDAHTAILMGVAKVLNSVKSELKGNVKLLFEPAEETSGGASVMVNEGVLENPHVDAVIGLHMNENIECGKIGIKKGVVNAASNPFNIKIIGKGGHGAHPEDTVDPVVISSNIILALQTLVSRELPPVTPAVITVSSIHAGSAENIIPEDVELCGIIRTMKKEYREYIIKRFKELVTGICTAMRGKCEIEFIEGYPCLYNDDSMYELLLKNARTIVESENIELLASPSMGVESFAYFSMDRPAVFYYVGCRNKDKGIVNPAHGSYFDIDEDCLKIGVAIDCATAFDFLNK